MEIRKFFFNECLIWKIMQAEQMSISREKMLSTRLLTACGVFPKASEW
jgi:hypothetical protein